MKGVTLPFKIGFLVVLFLGVRGTAFSVITIPNTPLGVTTAAKPMVLLIVGKDHKLFYEAYNDASDVDGDGVLDTRFKPNIVYYGLFDPTLCYTYSGDLFSPSSTSSDGKCSGQWSGNWLNYVTTSRVDVLRKVLYGGYREVDTASQTILRRAYIPQDAHSWAKEYTSTSVDGYDIGDYTPLSQPNSEKRHFFGNLTANEGINCSTLDNCSGLPPLLSVVENSSKRVWEWASKERPVLDESHGGTRTNYTVRVEVCTPDYHDGCKLYPNGGYKPIGLLQDYGEAETMLFGLLTGSYNKNMSGGVLRKVVSSFKSEIEPNTGQFASSAPIIRSLDRLRIRDFNNGRTDNAYKGDWVTTDAMEEGKFPDWGNPMGEMIYEGLRYFAGKASPTSSFSTSGGVDSEVGLSEVSWDNPYDKKSSAAKADWCAKANMIVISDINPSFDSDQVPGNDFTSFSGDLSGLNVKSLADTIGQQESINGNLYFIGQSGGTYDGAPTPKTVGSLGSIRGLAPEEPTKQGSYYAAACTYYGKTNDLNTNVQGSQTVDAFLMALASPLPRIQFPVGGKTITIVPFAKSVKGSSIDATKGKFQPTNQIVDFYVENIVNLPGAPTDPTINEGRAYAKFRINFEDVEQGADHDMDAVGLYEIQINASEQLEVRVTSDYAAGSITQHMGYVISGTTADGIYLVVRDKDTAEADDVNYFLDYPDHPGAALPLISTLTFSPGTSSGGNYLKDPLWYAAKWGGFIDRNGNKIPDLPQEWDADGDDVPDTYFLVQNPLKMEEMLKRTLDNVIERSASAGNITSNSTSLSTDTQVFQSIFNSAVWSGNILAYPVSKDGIGATATWQANEKLPKEPSRKIFTISGGKAVEFTWSNLSATDKTALGNSQGILNFLRGDRSKELQYGGTLRNRAIDNVLGDIVHSSPYYVKDTDTVYVGSNDGMLHAFNASSGVELFAFIPSAALSQIKNLSIYGYGSAGNPHRYFVDGDIAVSSKLQYGKNILIASLGHGGKGVFALDVTNPNSFGTTHVLWEYFGASDPDMGYVLGRPVIAKMNDGNTCAIVGNGYNSTNGKAVLYFFDLLGKSQPIKIDTKVTGDNGLSSPGVFDADGDGTVDYIYAGDLKGNVWKFDVSGKNTNQWDVAFKSGNTPKPFFVAKDPSGTVQPITAQITIAVNEVSEPNLGKSFVFFGTGSYFRTTDPTDHQIQSWYGLIDKGSQISGRSVLTKRTILEEGNFDNQDARTFSAASDTDMQSSQGWYLDFDTQTGERIVTASKLFKAVKWVLIASSIIPLEDPCSPGGTGYINAIDPFTGGSLGIGLFDLNKNSDFSDEKLNVNFIGGFNPQVGMPGEPVVIGNLLVVGGSSGTLTWKLLNMGVVEKGRKSWREIVN